MKIAFGVCSLGIGHATRSLPLIRALEKEGHEIVLISHGRAYTLLKKELPYLKIYNLVDYPIQYPDKAYQFIPYFFAKSNKILNAMLRGHREFLELHKKENFDLIISDSRYDIFHRDVPSFLIIHQLRIMLPMTLLSYGTMFYNAHMSKYYTKILVPDFEKNSLSGEMSHNILFIPQEKIEYIGPLSPFRNLDLPRDIDVLISISGPEPQRSIFERKVMEQLDDLDGNVIVTLGTPENDGKRRENTYHYLTFEDREKIMNRSKIIISRSGYSTIMDIYTIGGRAMFVPTPGQPEQEYLARYMEMRKIAGFVDQDSLNLRENLERVNGYRGFSGGYSTQKSVKRFLEVISH